MIGLLLALIAIDSISEINPKSGPLSFDVYSGKIFIGQWNLFHEIDFATEEIKSIDVGEGAILSILAEGNRRILSVAGEESKTVIYEGDTTSETQFFRWVYRWGDSLYACPDLEFAPFLAVKLLEDLSTDTQLFFRPRSERNNNFKRVWTVSDGEDGFYVAHQRESKLFHYPRELLKKLEVEADDGDVANYQLDLPMFVGRPLVKPPFVVYQDTEVDRAAASQKLFKGRSKHWNSFSRVVFFGELENTIVFAYTSPECGHKCRQKTIFHKISDDFEVGPPLILEEEFLVEEDGGLLYLLSVGGSKARIETLSVDLIPDF